PRDVAMGDPARELDLVTESLERARLIRDVAADHLERDLLVELAVSRAIHRAHATGSEKRQQVVAPHQRTADEIGVGHGSNVPRARVTAPRGSRTTAAGRSR